MSKVWQDILDEEFKKDYFIKLSNFLDDQYEQHVVYPKKEDIFSAFLTTPYLQCKVVILGQDPYHQPRQAHGLSFSVQDGVSIPPSLRNMYKELHSDLGIPPATTGCLIPWTKQGVLLLNTVLTVVKDQANSHKNKGWETFTDHVLMHLNDHPKPVVFVLWGNQAQQKERLITNRQHLIIKSAHPSPLSAYRGFFGSKPFSTINEFLIDNNREPIDWRIQ